MPNDLFGCDDYEKKNFAECHIFVNDEDFEVMDIPIIHAYPQYHLLDSRLFYWKKLGFANVRYEFVRVVERLVKKEEKSYETKTKKK